jgi:hypothetical protein
MLPRSEWYLGRKMLFGLTSILFKMKKPEISFLYG